jgi:hypothetical protein
VTRANFACLVKVESERACRLSLWEETMTFKVDPATLDGVAALLRRNGACVLDIHTYITSQLEKGVWEQLGGQGLPEWFIFNHDETPLAKKARTAPHPSRGRYQPCVVGRTYGRARLGSGRDFSISSGSAH